MSVLMRTARQSLLDCMAAAHLHPAGASPWETSLAAAIDVLGGSEGDLSDSEVLLLVALVQGGVMPLRNGSAFDIAQLTPAIHRACGIFESEPASTRELIRALCQVTVDKASLHQACAARSTPAWLRGLLCDLQDRRSDLAALGRILAPNLGAVTTCTGRGRRRNIQTGLAEIAFELERDIQQIIDVLDEAVSR